MTLSWTATATNIGFESRMRKPACLQQAGFTLAENNIGYSERKGEPYGKTADQSGLHTHFSEWRGNLRPETVYREMGRNDQPYRTDRDETYGEKAMTKVQLCVTIEVGNSLFLSE